MPDESSRSLINLGDVSKLGELLIEKISSALGGAVAPYQKKRMAKADAEVAMIAAQSEIQITALQRRAMHRWVEEEAQKQANIESITEKALPEIQEAANPQEMENDWVSNFFDKSRIVSDTQMQELWSKVLAGEANKPGTFSKKTVNLLSDLDKSDAELFSKLCGFSWVVAGPTPLVFDENAEIYVRNGIKFTDLTHLESIGLVNFNSLSGFRHTNIPNKFVVSYAGVPLILEIPSGSENAIDIGKVLFTRAGSEISSVCKPLPVLGFREYVEEHWREYLPQNTDSSTQVATNANSNLVVSDPTKPLAEGSPNAVLKPAGLYLPL